MQMRLFDQTHMMEMTIAKTGRVLRGLWSVLLKSGDLVEGEGSDHVRGGRSSSHLVALLFCKCSMV
jgi:hypothetical protein